MASPKNLPEQIPTEAHPSLPTRYFTEDEVCRLLGTTKRAFRQRPASARPPGRSISQRRRVYDPEEVAAWVQGLPRSK